MKVTKPTYEQALYLGVFFLGVILRFVKLNALPLSDLEAANALQVFTAVKGGPLISSPQAGYLGFTSILFFLFGSSDWLSRLIPAIAGSLLILAPL
jgi:predicted membrane-bound mannosyltransferase